MHHRCLSMKQPMWRGKKENHVQQIKWKNVLSNRKQKEKKKNILLVFKWTKKSKTWNNNIKENRFVLYFGHLFEFCIDSPQLQFILISIFVYIICECPLFQYIILRPYDDVCVNI